MKTMKTYIIKLINGVDLICRCETELKMPWTVESVEIIKPIMLLPMQNGNIDFIPWVMVSEDTKFPLPTVQISTFAAPTKKLEAHYLKGITGLTIAQELPEGGQFITN